MVDLYRQHAWVYDAAFSWDVRPEVDWLLARLGEDTASVLEPFCGAGRMFPAFVERGIAVAGVDRARPMLALARERLERHGVAEPALYEADVSDFDLGRTFDGAYCPVNSIAHLPEPDAAARHLRCMARHLPVGGRYLVQLDLRAPGTLRLNHPEEQGKWEVDHSAGRIAATWFVRDYDPARRMELHVSRFEILTGERAGQTIEATHEMRLWDWPEWRDLVADSPFTQVAAFDGNRPDRAPLLVGPALEGRPLAWHELEKMRDR